METSTTNKHIPVSGIAIKDVLQDRITSHKPFEAHSKSYEQAVQDVRVRVGLFGLREVHPLLLERLADMEYYAPNHNQDALIMAYEVMDILACYNIENLQNPISQELMEKTMLAVLLHDIGKSGPLSYKDRQGMVHEVAAENRKAVLKIYADETHIENTETTTVEEWVYTLFGLQEGMRYSEDPEVVLHALERCGMDRFMTMRQFFNRHAQDTYEILKASHMNEDTIAIACSHHLLEGINPVKLEVAKIPKEAKMIELTEKYVKQFIVRMLITLDKYEAFRRRGKQDHDQAIGKLHAMLWQRGLADDAGYMCSLHLLDLTKGAFLDK